MPTAFDDRALLSVLAEVSARLTGTNGARFELAGAVFGVRGDDALLATMMAALEHHPSPAAQNDDLSIVLWTGEPSPLLRANSNWRVAQRWSLGEVVRASSEAGMVFFDPVGGIVTLYDAAAGLGGIWIEDPASIPLWIAAAPFVRLLDAWFVRRRMMVCHGAAVVRGASAALIIGSGGAGKSTLAIRSIGEGFAYIGDDYVLLEPHSPQPIVHNLFNSAKLTRADLVNPVPSPFVIAREPDGEEDKFLLRISPEAIVASAPVALVVAPQIAGLDAPETIEITAADALRTALPSTIQQLPGADQARLSILAEALTVRCIRLNLATSSRRNVAMMGAQLAAQLPVVVPAA